MKLDFEDRLAIIFVVCSVLILCVAPAFAATLTWDANTESDLAGYNLYRAPGSCVNPGAFAKVQTYGKVTTGTDSPTVDGVYCWTLTAFDTGNLESVFSNKVEKSINVNPPVAPKNLVVQ